MAIIETKWDSTDRPEEAVVVGQTFWDYARREPDDHSLATVTRYVAGKEVPDMPTNLQILAEVLKNDGERVRDCIAAKRKRERDWKAAQRARKEAEKAGLSTGHGDVSTGQHPLSTQPTGKQEDRKEGQKEGHNKEEIGKEESGAEKHPQTPKKHARTPVPERNIIPPTEEMVSAYCLSRGGRCNPVRFMNYWESRGWMMRPGIRMKDWQAAVRTFESNGYDAGAGAPAQPQDAEPSDEMKRICAMSEAAAAKQARKG